MNAAVVLGAVAVAMALLAVDRWWRAARTRRQAIDALVAVPEMAGLAAPGAAARTAAVATALAEELGLTGDDVEQVALAARLRPLADLVPTEDAVSRARALTLLATDSGLSPFVRTVLDDTLTTGGGKAGRAAAAVRVATTFEEERAKAHATTAGALFATVVAHPAGHERRAAAALVLLVQGRPTSA